MIIWLVILLAVVVYGLWLFLPATRVEKLAATRLAKDSADFVNSTGYTLTACTRFLLSLLMFVLDTLSYGLGAARNWLDSPPIYKKHVDTEHEAKHEMFR